MGGKNKKRVNHSKEEPKRPNNEFEVGEEEEEDEVEDRRANWKSVDVNNDDNTFVHYFGPEGIDLCKLVGRTPQDWEDMLATLKRPLPSTFRVSPCGNFEKRTNRSLLSLVEKIVATTTYPMMDSNNVLVAAGPPQPIGQWVPEGWTTGTHRSGLKTDGPLKDLHQFLVRASETGAVSRQELVSMIPAILLKVKPGNMVLDMCAAPGSKSLQILEALGNSGVMVANDVDAKRAYMLTKRTKNVKSAGLVITTHDATQFPIQRLASKTQFFDRVLCDVPCSGSGTLRKNVNLFRTLKVRDGVGLHPMQVRIASRGIYCLRNQGLLVYSTCSFCPVENEAVVCELLRLFQGEIELVDVSDQLPGLKRANGVTGNWKVPLQTKDNKVHLFSTLADFHTWNAKEEVKQRQDLFCESMFPPANCEDLHLERCMRLLPHDQDSGGFFVAVFQKVRDVGEEKRNALATTGEEEEEGKEDHQKFQERKRNKNDVWYEPLSAQVLEEVVTEWGIVNLDPQSFQVRKGGGGQEPADGIHPSKISWLNNDVLTLFQSKNSKPLHLVHAGVLAFQKSKGNTYRVVNDYASMLLPYLTRRVVDISLKEVADMHAQGTADREPNVLIENLEPDQQAYVKSCKEGGLVLRLNKQDQARYEQEIGGVFAMSAWFGGQRSIRVMVDKAEMMELLDQMREVHLF